MRQDTPLHFDEELDLASWRRLEQLKQLPPLQRRSEWLMELREDARIVSRELGRLATGWIERLVALLSSLRR